jgi:hypothetical protein
LGRGDLFLVGVGFFARAVGVGAGLLDVGIGGGVVCARLKWILSS